MRCEACGATVSRWSASPLCPACHAITGGPLSLPDQRRPHSALWLWSSDEARLALASGDLAVIIRVYRASTGTSQRQLAELLGYDPTYISMIETGRRDIKDVATRLRIARHLGVPPHTLGVVDPDDGDFAAMLQFGESTIRLAVIARQTGRGAESVNELWPVVTRLEARVRDGHWERDVLLILARARAELGVSLGYVLPEERLASAARWTGRGLWLAERLGDQDLLAFALRVHGNELRKINHIGAAVARLRRASRLASDMDRGPVLVQLARAAGELGARSLFDEVIGRARRLSDADAPIPLVAPYALQEVELRGLVRTGRSGRAAQHLSQHLMAVNDVPPQWQAVLTITRGEAFLAVADALSAEAAFQSALPVAERHRLPHQIQRILRASRVRLPVINELARAALGRLVGLDA